uniref:Uncharacterized protein n=1 Tax=Manihot esculenta TaxID=3983 RepID=A0A2C9UUQ0_MANES
MNGGFLRNSPLFFAGVLLWWFLPVLMRDRRVNCKTPLFPFSNIEATPGSLVKRLPCFTPIGAPIC